MDFLIKQGNYLKMGAVICPDSVIYTFEGEKEEQCNILLYEKGTKNVVRIPVPSDYCIGSLRSIEICGLETDKYDYNYEIDGCEMTDPYARRIVGREKWADMTRKEEQFALRSGFSQSDFNWQEDSRPQIAKEDMVMYKLHVRNFTMDSASDGVKKGTFEAVEKRIPYLKEMGFTSIELMPVYEFEELVLKKKEAIPDYVDWKKEEMREEVPAVEKVNCWGYTTGNYFAPKASYAAGGNPEDSLKRLVYSLHKAQMECIMEMYFPAGTNPNLVLEALRYWVMEYHVDGFHLIGENLPLTAIVQDLILSRTKLFCDHFDESLLSQRKQKPYLMVYRDEFLYPARKVLNHQDGNFAELFDQIKKQGKDMGYVNYLASNNGFTLADLFMYSEKHNEENGECNADGIDWNYSANYGVEGPSRKKYVMQIRERQMRNAITLLLLSQGIPMVMEGDEIANSKNGNNNSYCQDNKTGWVNFRLKQSQEKYREYVRKMIAFRKEHPILHPAKPMQMHDYKGKGYPDLSLHTDAAWMTGITSGNLAIGLMYCGDYAKRQDGTPDDMIYVAYNFHTGKQFLALPKLPKGKKWYKVLDTGLEGGFLESPLCVDASSIEAAGMTIQILVGQKTV